MIVQAVHYTALGPPFTSKVLQTFTFLMILFGQIQSKVLRKRCFFFSNLYRSSKQIATLNQDIVIKKKKKKRVRVKPKGKIIRSLYFTVNSLKRQLMRI